MNLRLSWKLWTFMNSWRTFESRGGGRHFLLNLTAFSFLTHYGPLSQALKRRFLHSVRGCTFSGTQNYKIGALTTSSMLDNQFYVRARHILNWVRTHLSFGQYLHHHHHQHHYWWEILNQIPILASFLPACHLSPPPLSSTVLSSVLSLLTGVENTHPLPLSYPQATQDHHHHQLGSNSSSLSWFFQLPDHSAAPTMGAVGHQFIIIWSSLWKSPQIETSWAEMGDKWIWIRISYRTF